MFVAPSVPLLIAHAGFALQAQSGHVTAPCGTVALAMVTLTAHQDLRLAAGAQEKPAGLFVQDASGSTQ